MNASLTSETVVSTPASWLGRLFGLEHVHAVDAWQVSLAAPWAIRFPALVAVFTAAAAAAAVWFYLRWQPPMHRRTRTALAALRAGAAALLVLLLADPVLKLSVRHTPRPLLWLLFDGSESMAIEDELLDGERKNLVTATGLEGNEAGSSRADFVAAWLRKKDDNPLAALGETFRLRAFSIDSGDGVRPLHAAADNAHAPDGLDGEAVAAGLTTAGQVTALGRALEELSLRHSAANLQGVVLVSDFDQNAGPPATSAAQRLGVPFYCVGVGPDIAADVAVDVRGPPVMKKNERSLVTVTLRQSGLNGAVAAVTVTARPLDGPAATAGGAPLDLGTRSVQLSAGTVAVEFPFTPTEVGRHEFVAEVAKLEGESIDTNNRAVRETTVRDDSLRLEYVEYEPTWEWRFVKEVFQRDPLVGERGFRTFLRSADPQVRASNDLFLAAPAATRAEFFATDVLFLGDMPAAALSSRFCDLTREFVEEFGGGLVVIAGPRFGPAELAETAIGDMLPVVFDTARRPRDDRPFELALTPEAALVDFMQLGADEAENRRAWKNLGRLPWWQPVSRPHPQATVLAVHPTEKCADGRTPQPIIAVRRYGRGEVVYVGTNETWRLRKQYGERYYRQFWGQLMHRLGLGHAMGSQKRFVVRTDATTYRTDDTVIVTVEAFDADFQPLAADKLPDRTLAARLVRPDDTATGGTEILAIAEVRPGLFEARIPALAAGEHRILVEDPLAREPVQTAFTVTGLSVERRSVHRNVALQEAIAAATGGRSYDLTTAARLVTDIEPLTRPEHVLKVFPLSMTWACLFAGLTLLVAEWILRKQASLP
ncbi:MAG: hypothetical protein WED27_00820 [Pirellulales bacterium]